MSCSLPKFHLYSLIVNLWSTMSSLKRRYVSNNKQSSLPNPVKISSGIQFSSVSSPIKINMQSPASTPIKKVKV